jgi:hypothetical protein
MIAGGTLFLLVFGFSARSAEKSNTDDRKVPCCRRQNLFQAQATALILLFTIYTYYMHILRFWLYLKLPFLLGQKYENRRSRYSQA